MKEKKIKQLPAKHSNALSRIRKYFPLVKSVDDANESINITVTPEDSQKGRRKHPESCALARACVREKIADHAIIGIGFSYLIKGDHATRYKTSVGVGREITSFDRHQEFAAGKDYRLSKVGGTSRLGQRAQTDKTGPKTGPPKPKPLAVHRTANIRVLSAP